VPVKNSKTGRYENWSKYSSRVFILFAAYSLLLGIAAAANTPGGYQPYENETIAFLGHAAGGFFANILLTACPAYVVSEILLRKPKLIKWVVSITLFVAIMLFGLINMLSGTGLLEL
jgi:hypothetical protein